MTFKEFPIKPTMAQMRERLAFITEQVSTVEKYNSYLIEQLEEQAEERAKADTITAKQFRILEARVQSLEAEKQSGT